MVSKENIGTDKITDVAVNIFAKPFQTALALLSLYRTSGRHINQYWLQFEPMGSKFDSITTYYIAEYLQDVLHLSCNIYQPKYWLARETFDVSRVQDQDYRLGVWYQYAFENSRAKFLFIMHNDVYILKDIVGALLENIGDAVIIGQLGQCWNCPASNAKIMKKVMHCPPCGPKRYGWVKPTWEELKEIYQEGSGMYKRTYVDGLQDTNCQDKISQSFQEQPWPLPECRVNEWACLINLQIAQPLTMPFGEAFPFGCFQNLGENLLDTATLWFRDMHKAGLHAKHFWVYDYLKHWVGTGNKSAQRYAFSEDRALALLKKFFPDYIKWLEAKIGKTL